ncbi:MAG: prepilin-type N-terminal cleavage/methylation domain-containing protein [Candidatus Omnitrophica bacterium]|nr:prepilin-type N-terminal cleavage/methylation domain-containing protein [Candidatus Omnitrophota bacterium]
MTLRIGEAGRDAKASRRGITFIEVMVTAVILSAGLVAIYRAFFIGVDYLDHLSRRLCALDLIDNRVAVIERDFRALKDVDVGALNETVVLNSHPVDFTYHIQLKPVGQLLSVFQLDISLSWQERGREITISRSAYFSGAGSLEKGGGKS